MKKTIKGKCIIIFGLSGSGKSTISKLIHKDVQKKIGKTVILDGNETRDLFILLGKKFGFQKKERAKTAKPTMHLLNLFLNQNINVIYNNIGLNNIAYNIWKNGIKNLTFVYMKSDVKKIIKFGKKKKVYNLKKDVVGVHIKPDIPKKPHIIIENNFDKSVKHLSKLLLNKLKKRL